MLKRFLVGMIVAALGLIPVAQASIYTIFTLVPPALNSSQALGFKTDGSWKRLDEMPYSVCFSCTVIPIGSNDGLRVAKSMYFVVYMLNAGDVRLISFFHDYTCADPNRDASCNVWKRDYPPLSAMPTPGTPGACHICARFANITVDFNQLFADHLGEVHQFMIEVKGTGTIYGVRLQLDYAQAK